MVANVFAKKSERLSWNILDISGKSVLTDVIQLAQELNVIRFDLAQLQAGTYVLVMEVNEHTQSHQFVVIK
ncbi:MAG: T9SS type A sorting domain-containing protein [Flavobacteriales bacterium]|nr:T9SS type A sorting domain-containing protein [Flavobacteriales bacterium]